MTSLKPDKRLSPHERLFLDGRLIDFEKAVLAGNRQNTAQLLKDVGYNAESAKEISQEILADPRRYGYCPGGCLTQKPRILSTTSNLLLM